MKHKPGDKIMVKVGGQEYETIIDEYGVQRFIANGVMKVLQQNFFDEWDKYCKTGLQMFIGNEHLEPMGYNKLAVMYIQGAFSQRDYLEFYMSTGSSVSLIAEMSFFEDLEIENPLWENEGDNEIS